MFFLNLLSLTLLLSPLSISSLSHSSSFFSLSLPLFPVYFVLPLILFSLFFSFPLCNAGAFVMDNGSGCWMK
jgi:hypothetical protein